MNRFEWETRALARRMGLSVSQLLAKRAKENAQFKKEMSSHGKR